MTVSDPRPFTDLDAFVATPRVERLDLSPDGSRVVLTVAALDAERTGYERALWEVPADGSGTPRRLTRSTKGESGPGFTGSGDLLFVSARPGSGAPSENGDKDPAQVWLLPADGGEARPVTALAGGVNEVAATAVDTDVVVLSAGLLPGASTLEQEATLRADRKKLKVSAILHERYPVRFWDHDLGPDEPHLLALDAAALGAETVPTPGTAEADEAVEDGAAPDAPYPAHLPRPADLTPHPGRSADTAGQVLTPDGRTLVAALRRPQHRAERFALTAIDVATGARTTLFDEPSTYAEGPVISHDGTRVAFVRSAFSTPAGASDQHLWVIGVDGSAAHEIAAGWDRWPAELAFAHDDTALIVVADQDGRAPVFRVPLDGGAPEQLTHDDFAYSSVRVDRVSGDVLALRSNWNTAPHPVRVARDGSVTTLATPAPPPAPAARMTEVETRTEDGTRLRAWLLLPPDASTPAPLLLWIHGGPLNSWNAWSWRWCAQLAVARGYAVLLPDPALSTGYGLAFIQRGWNAWGGAPFTDLMAITDATVARDDVDQTRTAAMGGSFGGYMANWVAGHTDRFQAIVTHASLWALDQFAGTTDGSNYWEEIFTPEAMLENSPHRFLERIVTPMLVIHGDRDYRVPIGEANRLWSELARRFAAEDGSLPHRYLYFPDENHWILSPQHAKVWYETVFAFLAEHVLGEEGQRPRLLG